MLQVRRWEIPDPVIDILKYPKIARRNEIIANPTLSLVPRTPVRRTTIGIFSGTRKVCVKFYLTRKVDLSFMRGTGRLINAIG